MQTTGGMTTGVQSPSEESTSTAALRRRTFLKGVGLGAGLLGVTPALGACAAFGGGKRKLTISDFGGELSKAYREVFYDDFEKEFDVRIEVAPTVSMGTLKAQADSGNPEWDLVETSPYFFIRAGKLGYVEEIDYDRIGLSKMVEPDALYKYSVGFNSYSDVISWNTSKTKGKPKSWSDFWDQKAYPGARSYISYPEFGALEQPLLAAGVAPEDVYKVLSKPGHVGVQASLTSLQKLGPYVTKWWSYGAEPATAVANGSVSMAYSWSGRVAPLMRQGAPVSFTYDHGIIVLDSLAIVKGSKNVDLAHKFINFTLDPRRQAKLAELTTYGPVNLKAFDYVSDAKLSAINTAPINRKRQIVLDQKWTAANLDYISTAYSATVAKFSS